MNKRIGPKLQSASIESEQVYVLDIQLTFCHNSDKQQRRVDSVVAYLTKIGGRVSDTYNKGGLSLLRAHVQGKHIEDLLTRPNIFQVDFPPQPDLD